jgi:hypothetical protein
MTQSALAVRITKGLAAAPPSRPEQIETRERDDSAQRDQRDRVLTEIQQPGSGPARRGECGNTFHASSTTPNRQLKTKKPA